MRYLLLPVSWLYSVTIALRHLLYDLGLLNRYSANIPVISVGNLSMGGTGKTPHIEYLIRLFKANYRVATLSRGYKRKTSGFLLADAHSKVTDIGDEPKQFLTKFNDIFVAVDEKRKRGIRILLAMEKAPDIILLDDAFQHLPVKPGMNILLTDYHHLYTKDYLFPTGTLRDNRKSAKNADIIIVTKTPTVFSPFIADELYGKIKPRPHQKLFFSYLKYGKLKPVQKNSYFAVPRNLSSVLLVTGIANTYPLKEYLQPQCTVLIELSFPDHHQYTEKDVQLIEKKFNDIIGKNKIIVTTEKDAVRFRDSEYLRIFEQIPLFYLPIEVAFHSTKGISFDEMMLDYVRKNQRNS